MDVVSSEATDGVVIGAQSRSIASRAQHLLHRYPTISPLLVLVASFVVFTAFGNGRFQRPDTVGIMLQQTAVLATLAIGQTLIILTAGIDLAVGTAMLFTHLIIAKLFADNGWPAVLALLIGALAGVVLGAFHGFLVTRFKLPPFIVTLGTFYIFSSLGLVYSEAKTTLGDDLGGKDGLLLWTGRQISLGSMKITVGVLLMVVLYLVFAYVLSNTAWGRHVYATGDDPEAARLAGINTARVLFSVYAVAGLVYALGAWVQLGRAGTASVNAAADVNLESITAVVIGGTSLFGGRGRLFGSLIGAFIVVMFRNGLSLAEVSVYWQNFAIGSLILVAVGLDQWIRKMAR